ncbi:hypothetical protein BD626DRAFT_564149 [Schizophyllum amplum]|uniref:C2H2-type domain-containing protein n=1 Tax=Schizophyllum amplum TaxID=97359 RepID=A0A550D0G6_9AGAR|nr:hypothetical protein BD626DRAFT_564149 [Auriculariopsis ampla]
MSSPNSPTYASFGARSPYSSGSSASFPNEDSPAPDPALEDPVIVSSDYAAYHMSVGASGMPAVCGAQPELAYQQEQEQDMYAYPPSLMMAWNNESKKQALHQHYQQQIPSQSELERYKSLMAYSQGATRSQLAHHVPAAQNYMQLDADSWQAYPASLGHHHLGHPHLGQQYAGHGYATVKQEEQPIFMSTHTQPQPQLQSARQSSHVFDQSAHMQATRGYQDAYYEQAQSQPQRSQQPSYLPISSSYEQHYVHLSDVSPVESPVSPVSAMDQAQLHYPSDLRGCDPRSVSGQRRREDAAHRDIAANIPNNREDGEEDAEGEDDDHMSQDASDLEDDVDEEEEQDDDGEYVLRRGRRASTSAHGRESRNLRLRSTPMRAAAASRYDPYAYDTKPATRSHRASSMTAASSTSSTSTTSSDVLASMYLPTLNGQPVSTRRRPRPATSLPIPVPVPNLTKKSRGRRVPTVPTVDHTRLASAARASADGEFHGSAGRRRSTKGLRLYTCKVGGCGKCFARGEHLKRHVRSIHTYEKPHKCPYPGCGKDFSRHDNLGQHMRVHKDFVLPKGMSLNGFRAAAAAA